MCFHRPAKRRRIPALRLLLAAASLAAGAALAQSTPPPQADDVAVEETSDSASTLLERRRQARSRAVAGITHVRNGDLEAACRELEAAVDGWPQHVQFVYALATCEARLGQSEDALSRLEDLIRRGYAVPLAQDPALASVRESEKFRALIQEMDALQERQVGRENLVFELPDPRMVPEAVAFDPETGSYFVSSIHQRKIVRRDAKGKLTALQASRALWSVSGLAVDAPRRLLWAGTGALPNMQGYLPEDNGKTALVAFDLDSGKEVLRFQRQTQGHRLADLTIAADGTVFVSDAAAMVWRTVMTANAQGEGPVDENWRRFSESSSENPTSERALPSGLEVVSPPDFLRSPQGLAVSGDQKRLFVADYSFGISVFERASGRWFYLEEPEGVALFGIDGLHVMDGQLVAIQNGSRPQRILRLWSDLSTRRIMRSEVVAMNLPSWSEPTLGTVVGEDFVYVANSQWDRFDADSQLPSTDTLAAPRILRWSPEDHKEDSRP